jgi:hypothetical protein
MVDKELVQDLKGALETTRRFKEATTKKDLLDQYFSATRKRSRGKLFLKILAHNMKGRNVNTAAALVVVPSAIVSAMGEMLYHTNTRRAVAPQRNVPRSLQFVGVRPEMVEFSEIVLRTSYRGVPVRKIIMGNTIDGLKAYTGVLVILSIIETIFDVTLRKNRGRVYRRHKLVSLAKDAGVTNADHMNMDQLRFSILESLVLATK